MPPEKHLFRPDVVHKPPTLTEAEHKSEVISERFCGEGIAVIAELLQLVENMPIPSRFNRATELKEITGRLGAHKPLTATTKAAIEQEGEAGLKRAQLQADLVHIQSQLLHLTGRLQRVVVDIEATQTE